MNAAVACAHGSAVLMMARKESSDLMDRVALFLEKRGECLPEGARADLRDLVGHRNAIADISSPTQMACASSLLAFKLAALDFNMGERESRSRRLVDRAFLHLERLLVVDEDVQQKWQEAFDERETKCEQLGGVHLLQHGIWAFKVDGSGARTDLVLGTPMSQDDLDHAAQAADVLTLTEWKLARAVGEVEPKYWEAISQLKSYAALVLAGVELESMRYAVTVGHDRADTRADVVEGGVVFRHVHVAIAPSSPSDASRKFARARRAQGRPAVP